MELSHWRDSDLTILTCHISEVLSRTSQDAYVTQDQPSLRGNLVYELVWSLSHWRDSDITIHTCHRSEVLSQASQDENVTLDQPSLRGNLVYELVW